MKLGRKVAAHGGDAGENDDPSGLVLDPDLVAGRIVPSRELGDLGPGGADVRQDERSPHRDDGGVAQHFEIADVHVTTSSAPTRQSPAFARPRGQLPATVQTAAAFGTIK